MSSDNVASLPGHLLAGQYQILSHIGQGGMGDLYRGVDTRTGEAIAIKALKPEIVAGNPELVIRFEREGEALRQLEHGWRYAGVTALGLLAAVLWCFMSGIVLIVLLDMMMSA